jgi:hypothetical protein
LIEINAFPSLTYTADRHVKGAKKQ